MQEIPNLILMSINETRDLVYRLWNDGHKYKDQLQNTKKELKETKDEFRKISEELKKTREELEKIKKAKENPKTSKNSSNPPSKDQKANIEPKEPESAEENLNKKKDKHRNGGRKLHEKPDAIKELFASTCPHCDSFVDKNSQSLEGVFENIELPQIAAIITQIRQYGGTCPCCEKKYKAELPSELENRSPFGQTVENFIIYMRYSHSISYQRLSILMYEMFQLKISQGAIAEILKRAKARTKPVIDKIQEKVRNSEVIYSDETSARTQGQTQWEWVFQNVDVCLHVIHASRGAKVIEEVMGTSKPEVWISDLYKAQEKHPAQKWQICLAHQIRDCNYGIDCGDKIFCPVMKEIILKAIETRNNFSSMTKENYLECCEHLKVWLKACLTLMPTEKNGIRLHKRYLKHRDNMLLFLDDFRISPTNNSSEQALRPSVIFRKVTNGFRSDWGRDFYAAIRSILHTGKRHGLSAYEAIIKALDSPDSFLPALS